MAKYNFIRKVCRDSKEAEDKKSMFYLGTIDNFANEAAEEIIEWSKENGINPLTGDKEEIYNAIGSYNVIDFFTEKFKEECQDALEREGMGYLDFYEDLYNATIKSVEKEISNKRYTFEDKCAQVTDGEEE